MKMTLREQAVFVPERQSRVGSRSLVLWTCQELVPGASGVCSPAQDSAEDTDRAQGCPKRREERTPGVWLRKGTLHPVSMALLLSVGQATPGPELLQKENS